MRILQLLLFILASVLEIRVTLAKEKTVESESVRYLPQSCLHKALYPCSMATAENQPHRIVLKAEGEVLTLDQASILTRLSSDQFRLIKGQVWIQSNSKLSVETEFGRVFLAEGEVWIRRGPDRVWISNSGGNVQFEPRNASARVELAIGEENWLGPVDASGVAQSGRPLAIPLAAHLKRWSRLSGESPERFREKALRFHQNWQRQLASVSEFHQRQFIAHLNKAEAEARERSERRAKVEEENRRLREMFRRKVLLD